ncbi:MAG: Crp/Fnr family transcriptional regulator [Gammaproteobacteria bacterium]|nr:Crp/Fnr family transcriptional regulator [Gammaproteobacteria bacterium]
MQFKSFCQQEIREHYLFKSMSDAGFQSLIKSCGLLLLKRNETLFQHNDSASYFYLVRTGQMALFQNAPDGKEKIIDIYEPEQLFAESILFSEEQYYSSNAKAIIDSQVYYFHAHNFKAQLEQSTELCFSLMTQMNKRIKSQTQEIIELTLYDAQYRLINYLLTKCCGGNFQNCTRVVILPTSKGLLASRLSITSETFSRILTKLKTQGLLTIEHERIILNEPSKLRALIGG